MNAIKGNVVVVGAGGYWGSILVRAAIELFGANHIVALDADPASIKLLTERLQSQNILSSDHSLNVVCSLDEALHDSDNRYFVIATPPISHFTLAMRVLAHDRHILITKPLALSTQDAEHIYVAAKERKVTAMVDHTFLFHPAVTSMATLVKSGAIGTPKTFHAEWLSRGKIQEDTNVIWDLAPHPISILLEFWEFPINVDCKVLDGTNGVPTEASLYLTEQRTGNSALILVSWMDSNKSRMFKIRGSHHTIIFDDTQAASAKLRIRGGKTPGHHLLSQGYEGPIEVLNYPDEKLIAIDSDEPLKNELVSFINSTKHANRADSIYRALACVKLIEAAGDSIKQGETITVNYN